MFLWFRIFMPCHLVLHFQVLHFQSTRSNAQRTSERPLTAEAEQFEEDGMGV